MIGYRIVEIKNGKVYSLFHGTNHSREIKLNKWNLANIKLVQDGSGQKKKYISGWHFLKNKETAINFFNKMFRIKQNRYIIKCEVKGNIRPKHEDGKGEPCLLAESIRITAKDVEEALKR